MSCVIGLVADDGVYMGADSGFFRECHADALAASTLRCFPETVVIRSGMEPTSPDKALPRVFSPWRGRRDLETAAEAV